MTEKMCFYENKINNCLNFLKDEIIINLSENTF